MSAHTLAYRSSHPRGQCEGTFATRSSVQQTGQNRTIHLGPGPLRPANDHHPIIPVSQTKCYSPYINHSATTRAREQGAANWASHVYRQRTNFQPFLTGEWEKGGPHFSLIPWPWTQQRQEAASYLDPCTGNENKVPIKKWLALWLQSHVMNSLWFWSAWPPSAPKTPSLKLKTTCSLEGVKAWLVRMLPLSSPIWALVKT